MKNRVLTFAHFGETRARPDSRPTSAMSDDNPLIPDDPEATWDGELTAELRETIESACDNAGFPLDDIGTRGDILKLAPASVDSLPNASVLTELADALEARGFRYVTFAVPESET